MNARASANPYVTLTEETRIVFMVLVTATWGYFLGGDGSFVAMLTELVFWATMAGTGLAAAGGAVLNQYLERDTDAAMVRTRNRPLPSGQVRPTIAFGLWLTLAGLAILLLWVNLLTAFLVLLTEFLYVLVYTPMKRLSPLNTTSERSPAPCLRSSVGLPRTVPWPSKDCCSSSSSSSGSTRMSTPSDGCIATTTPAPVFACCPWATTACAPPSAWSWAPSP